MSEVGRGLPEGDPEPAQGLSLELVLEGTVSPSEDRGKVLTAAANVLGECRCEDVGTPDLVRFVSDDWRCLQKVHDQLRDRRVRDSARRLLIRRREGDGVSLLLNRQAAFRGIVVVCDSEDESPLGPLVLALRSRELDRVIDWLTLHGPSD